MKQLVIVLLAAALLVSCSDDSPAVETDAAEPTTTTTAPAVTPNPLTVEVGTTEPVPGQVLLWVGNQSFVDASVELRVTIDGHEVANGRFPVEDQHNWIGHLVDGLEPGRHTITASSDTDVEFSADFSVVDGEPRWLVLNYWFYEDDPLGRHFSFDEHDESVYFL